MLAAHPRATHTPFAPHPPPNPPPTLPAYPAYPDPLSPSPSLADCDMPDAGAPARHASKTRRVHFCETVLVLETHAKADYDRTSVDMAELGAEDIREVLDMRREFRRQTQLAARLAHDREAALARLHLARALAAHPVFPVDGAQARRHARQGAHPGAPVPGIGADPNGAFAVPVGRARPWPVQHPAGAPADPPSPAHRPADLPTPSTLPPHLPPAQARALALHLAHYQASQLAAAGSPVPAAAFCVPRARPGGFRAATVAPPAGGRGAQGWAPPSPPASPEREGEGMAVDAAAEAC